MTGVRSNRAVRRSRSRLSGRVFLLTCLVGAFPETAISNDITIIIETRILDFDPFSGMKSKQTLSVDMAAGTVESRFETGVTDFGVIEIGSLRDDFTVSDILMHSGTIKFAAKGQTASGVAIMPDIDYGFNFVVESDKSVTVSGCHDAYPAYKIMVDGEKVYEFKHESKNLIALFGTCDIDVDID